MNATVIKLLQEPATSGTPGQAPADLQPSPAAAQQTPPHTPPQPQPPPQAQSKLARSIPASVMPPPAKTRQDKGRGLAMPLKGGGSPGHMTASSQVHQVSKVRLAVGASGQGSGAAAAAAVAAAAAATAATAAAAGRKRCSSASQPPHNVQHKKPRTAAGASFLPQMPSHSQSEARGVVKEEMAAGATGDGPPGPKPGQGKQGQGQSCSHGQGKDGARGSARVVEEPHTRPFTALIPRAGQQQQQQQQLSLIQELVGQMQQMQQMQQLFHLQLQQLQQQSGQDGPVASQEGQGGGAVHPDLPVTSEPPAPIPPHTHTPPPAAPPHSPTPSPSRPIPQSPVSAAPMSLLPPLYHTPQPAANVNSLQQHISLPAAPTPPLPTAPDSPSAARSFSSPHASPQPAHHTSHQGKGRPTGPLTAAEEEGRAADDQAERGDLRLRQGQETAQGQGKGAGVGMGWGSRCTPNDEHPPTGPVGLQPRPVAKTNLFSIIGRQPLRSKTAQLSPPGALTQPHQQPALGVKVRPSQAWDASATQRQQQLLQEALGQAEQAAPGPPPVGAQAQGHSAALAVPGARPLGSGTLAGRGLPTPGAKVGPSQPTGNKVNPPQHRCQPPQKQQGREEQRQGQQGQEQQQRQGQEALQKQDKQQPQWQHLEMANEEVTEFVGEGVPAAGVQPDLSPTNTFDEGAGEGESQEEVQDPQHAVNGRPAVPRNQQGPAAPPPAGPVLGQTLPGPAGGTPATKNQTAVEAPNADSSCSEGHQSGAESRESEDKATEKEAARERGKAKKRRGGHAGRPASRNKRSGDTGCQAVKAKRSKAKEPVFEAVNGPGGPGLRVVRMDLANEIMNHYVLPLVQAFMCREADEKSGVRYPPLGNAWAPGVMAVVGGTLEGLREHLGHVPATATFAKLMQKITVVCLNEVDTTKRSPNKADANRAGLAEWEKRYKPYMDCGTTPPEWEPWIRLANETFEGAEESLRNRRGSGRGR